MGLALDCVCFGSGLLWVCLVWLLLGVGFRFWLDWAWMGLDSDCVCFGSGLLWVCLVWLLLGLSLDTGWIGFPWGWLCVGYRWALDCKGWLEPHSKLWTPIEASDRDHLPHGFLGSVIRSSCNRETGHGTKLKSNRVTGCFCVTGQRATKVIGHLVKPGNRALLANRVTGWFHLLTEQPGNRAFLPFRVLVTGWNSDTGSTKLSIKSESKSCIPWVTRFSTTLLLPG